MDALEIRGLHEEGVLVALAALQKLLRVFLIEHRAGVVHLGRKHTTTVSESEYRFPSATCGTPAPLLCIVSGSPTVLSQSTAYQDIAITKGYTKENLTDLAGRLLCKLWHTQHVMDTLWIVIDTVWIVPWTRRQ